MPLTRMFESHCNYDTISNFGRNNNTVYPLASYNIINLTFHLSSFLKSLQSPGNTAFKRSSWQCYKYNVNTFNNIKAIGSKNHLIFLLLYILCHSQRKLATVHTRFGTAFSKILWSVEKLFWSMEPRVHVWR